MPTYDYRCEANGEIFEVRHRMSEHLANWGELCERAELDPGQVPPETPVSRLATGGQVVRSVGSGPAPACEAGPCCGGGRCEL